MRNKILTAIGIVILILVLTNPTMTDFKSFIPTSKYSSEIKKDGSLGREYNFLICSIYTLKIDNYSGHKKERYFSILKNFIYIPRKNETIINEVVDSVKSDIEIIGSVSTDDPPVIDLAPFDSVMIAPVESLIRKNDIPLIIPKKKKQ